VSTRAHAPHPTIRTPVTSDLLAAGLAPCIIVALAGFSIGFFAWLSLIVPRHHPLISDLGLIVALAGGTGATLWLWQNYAHYFSRRAGATYARSLRYDAFTWAPFILLWLTFVLPLGFTHGESRIFVICATVFCVGKVLIAARFNQTVREVLLDFVATRAAIIVIAELAAVIIGQRAGSHVQESTNLLLNVWGRWDAVHYLTIATQGYQGTDMAFFPLFPLLIRILGSLVGNHLIAGLLISNASFFFGLLYLYKLLEHEYDRSVARRAIFYVSIFPSAFFFSAVYTESLFFMLTVASFYYMRSHRWWIAGAIGFFAALTRVEGVLLAVPFAIEWYLQYKPKLYGAPVGLGWRSALLLARAESLEPAFRAALGQRHQFIPPNSDRNPGTDDRQSSIRTFVHVSDDRGLDHRVEATAPVVHRLYGALDSDPHVDLEPDEHAALRARPLPDVRDSCARRRAAVGQQRHPRLLAPAPGPVHRTLCRLVLGCLTASRH
jgi:hypothetical protein